MYGFLMLNNSSLWSQNFGYQKWITLKSDTTVLDSNSIVFGTFQCSFDSTDYRLDYEKALFILLNQNKQHTKLGCSYHTFAFRFSTQYLFHDSIVIEDIYKELPTDVFRDQYLNAFSSNQNSALSSAKITQSGSISRSISTGNNQNLSLNSDLNLQLGGKLTDDIQIEAVISDNNLPIQAEGNTQQLQDFDRVFIRLFNPNHNLLMGDFEESYSKGRFSRYLKKNRGGQYQYVDTLNDHVLNVQVSGALSKGQYIRYQLPVLEGNQGPYKLKGNNNELFVTVLSGTEQVFFNGKKLVRGLENDYTINYNTAEIRFTHRVPVTRDSRIQVDYQYSDKNYSRSVFTQNGEWSKGKTKSYWSIYSEQDSKNQPVQIDLNEQDIEKLTEAGNQDNIFKNTIDSVGYADNEIRYEQKDSLGYTNVLVFSNNKQKAHFRAIFSLVGANNGNYIPSTYTPFGYSYEWIEPVNGVPQGNYEPVLALIAPKRRTQVTVGQNYALDFRLQSVFQCLAHLNQLHGLIFTVLFGVYGPITFVFPLLHSPF